MVKFCLGVVPVQFPSPKEVQDFFYRGDWLLDDSSHVEVFIFVFVEWKRLVKGVLLPKQVKDLFVVDLNVGTPQKVGFMLVLFDIFENIFEGIH